MKKNIFICLLLAPLLGQAQNSRPSASPASDPSVQKAGTGQDPSYIIQQAGPSPLDIISLQPANINAVPAYSKLELGVNLLSLYVNQINAFLNETTGKYKPGTSGYTTAFSNGTIINPYDAQQISVDVAFYRPSSPNSNPVIRHGFYYKTTAPTPATNPNDWLPATTPNYPWRVRFAPDEVGTWTYSASVYIHGILVQWSFNSPFTVVATRNPGFVQIGPNPNYLQYSASRKTYIPMGNNYTWALSHSDNGGAFPVCATQNCNVDGIQNIYDHRMNYTAVAELNNFVNILTLPPGGANTTRLLMVPWGFQIEFEKLGNYDSRQIEMSVLDDYIGLLEQKNIKLILGQGVVDMSNGALGWQTPSNYAEGWLGNPYNGSISGTNYPHAAFKGIAGINNPQDLWDPNNPGYATALQFYKNRWRYIESRWGYSTAISTYELLTEVDQMLDINKNNVYWNVPNMEKNAANWFNNIALYLKVNLGTKHLTTVSYTGYPDPFKLDPNAANPPQVGQSFQKQYIDIVSAHCYGSREVMNRVIYNVTQIAKNAFPSKPIYFNECDDLLFDATSLCSDLTTHNYNWSSLLTGCMGPGLAWAQQRYYIQWSSHFPNSNYAPPQNGPGFATTPDTYSGEYDHNFAALSAFANQIDFQTTSYSYYFSRQPSTPMVYEELHMVDKLKQKAFGWVHNRSYTTTNNTPCYNDIGPYPNMGNYRDHPLPGDLSNSQWFAKNAPQNPNGYFYDDEGYVTAFGSAGLGYDPVPVQPTNIVISNLAPNTLYDITWIWTWGSKGGQDAPAYNQTFILSDPGGNLTVATPPTGTIRGTLYPGDWAYRIVINAGGPQPRLGISIPSPASKLMVSPNPSSDIFYISANEGPVHAKADIELFDIRGKLLLSESIPDVDHFPMDLRERENGIYFLKVTVNHEQSVFKLVKTN